MSDNTISIKDPQMEYAYHFASVIDPIYEEDYLFDKDGKVIVDKKGRPKSSGIIVQTGIGDKLPIFVDRLAKNKICNEFTEEAFYASRNIMETLEAYHLDPNKFWYLMLFVYDMCTSSIEGKDRKYVAYVKTNKEIYNEIQEYIEKHPKFSIYLSDGDVGNKKERLELGETIVLFEFKRYIKRKLRFYNRSEFLNGDAVSYDANGVNIKYDKTIANSIAVTYMYEMFMKFFEIKKLPDLRTVLSRDADVNKQFLISRILHFCGVVQKKAYIQHQNALKGVISQYRHKLPRIDCPIYGVIRMD